MSKEFVDLIIDNAHKSYLEGNPRGVIEQIKSIKLRIHNKEVEEQISKFERETDSVFDIKANEIEKTGKNSMEKVQLNLILEQEKLERYIDFYDRINKENELF